MLSADSPVLDGYPLRHCAEVQAEIARRFDGQNPLELRLLIEFFVATWRCTLDEWLPDRTPGELPELLRLSCSSMNSAFVLEA